MSAGSDMEHGRDRVVAAGIDVAAESRNSIDDIWGPRTPFEVDWPARIDERLLEEPERWVRSACVLCSNGCGLEIGVRGDRIVGVRGLASDAVNRGRLGPKGLHAWESTHSKDRLLYPRARRHGKLVRVDWDEAMALIVERSRELLAREGSGAIGFYTSGQLFLEEYYTLCVIGKAGLGTPHMDGNTRLCTATAAQALKESFGTDGQPGCYRDLDLTDAIFMVGHNVAATQTVLWSRILDRRRGPSPPRLVVVDPRETPTAREADIHLAPRAGTNVALLNGLLSLIIEAGQIDADFIARHTTGFDALRETVRGWPPERVERTTGVPAARLRAAADLLGSARTLVSTALQGVYQSMQATAAAVQINNLQLIRGLIGRPGCAVLQMNGQPTAQNTRECGADGDLPGFRNWQNPQHVAELARLWKVEERTIPHWAPPTHAMQIWRYAELGSIKLIWISGTNPAVSLPDAARIRRILTDEGLFVVAQDGFPTETTELADVVLPAAIWGEKTGTFTNADRTVHLSEKAVAPPGEARSDLDIFLDYARRMDFRNLDGEPLIAWHDAESAFEAWKACSRGRPCDYSGISYDLLRERSGVRWPCNEANPRGTERLYVDGIFNTSADRCEDFGHDLTTGAAVDPIKYRADDPEGKARLKAADHEAPVEAPDEEYPLWLTTGRVAHHFHTRTKTARSSALQAAAPEPWVELSREDMAALKIEPDDSVIVESRRGRVVVRAALGKIAAGHAFMPFHYGWWDDENREGAANELTLTSWDAVSKQPHFKYAAVRVRPYRETLDALESVARTAVQAVSGLLPRPSSASTSSGNPLAFAAEIERRAASAFEAVARKHADEPDVAHLCTLMARWSTGHAQLYQALAAEREPGESADTPAVSFGGPREGPMGLLRDLHDLYLLASEANLARIVLHQASRASRDAVLDDLCKRCRPETERQLAWLTTRIKQSAPQTLTIP